MFDDKKYLGLCTENDIEPIYSPAKDHRAIELERFIQTLKKISMHETSNITTKPDSKHLSYNEITQHYIDEHMIRGRSYLADEQWTNTGMSSDLEVDKFICFANANAHEQENMQDSSNCLM